jgi:hypothetical protein
MFVAVGSAICCMLVSYMVALVKLALWSILSILSICSLCVTLASSQSKVVIFCSCMCIRLAGSASYLRRMQALFCTGTQFS